MNYIDVHVHRNRDTTMKKEIPQVRIERFYQEPYENFFIEIGLLKDSIKEGTFNTTSTNVNLRIYNKKILMDILGGMDFISEAFQNQGKPLLSISNKIVSIIFKKSSTEILDAWDSFEEKGKVIELVNENIKVYSEWGLITKINVNANKLFNINPSEFSKEILKAGKF